MASRPAAGAFPAEGTTPSTPTGDIAGQRALPWWPCVLAALLTAVVAFWGITAPEYWHDEAATVSAVTRPLPELLRMLGNVDAVHALYYVVLHPWAGVFGTSELALRTPSALALTIMAIPLTRLSMTWAGQITGSAPRAVTAGVFTAVLTATLPGLSWAGQEARGYALGMLTAVAALWCFQRFLTHGHSTALVCFGLAQAAAVGFTMYALLVLPLYVLRAARTDRAKALGTAVVCALIVVVVSPLLVLAASQSGQVGWIDTTVSEMLARMSAQYFFSPANAEGHWGTISQALALWMAGVCALIVVAGLILARTRGVLVWLVAYVGLPMVALLAARVVGLQLYTERYLAFAAPAVVLLVALGLSVLPHRAVSTALLAVLVAAFVPSLVGQNAPEAKIGHEYRTAAEYAEGAQTVIFMEAVDRSLYIAYPPVHHVEDPMLAQDRISSATLWGVNREGWMAWQVPAHGETAVVSHHANGYHQKVVDSLVDRGCTATGNDASTRFSITRLNCPEDPPAP